MRPGDPFPSVRALSKALKINPNTAHKVVTHLVAEGLIEVRPGLGTVVAELPASTAAERSALLKKEVEQLVVEAKKLGLDLDEVTDAVEKLHFNVCVAHIYEFANTLNEVIGDADSEDGSVAPDFTWAMREAANILVQLFHPMMPHLAEECWASLGHDTLVSQSPWPQVERDLLVEETMTLPVQVNGKKRADVTVPRNAANAEIEAAVLALDAVKKALEGKSPRKVIIVPQRIVNVVA